MRTMLARTACKQQPDRTDRYCIIGAGASGLAVAKNFVAARHPLRLPGA